MAQSKLQRKYFDFIKSGEKIYEGRRASWLKEKDLKLNDTIIFTNENNSIRVKIVQIIEANNFGELYDMFGKKLLPDVSNRNAAIDVYEKIYPENKEKVVALKIEIIS